MNDNVSMQIDDNTLRVSVDKTKGIVRLASGDPAAKRGFLLSFCVILLAFWYFDYTRSLENWPYLVFFSVLGFCFGVLQREVEIDICNRSINTLYRCFNRYVVYHSRYKVMDDDSIEIHIKSNLKLGGRLVVIHQVVCAKKHRKKALIYFAKCQSKAANPHAIEAAQIAADALQLSFCGYTKPNFLSG